MRMAEEIEAIDLPPCQRQQEEGDLSGCSALKVVPPDYLELRDDVRAMESDR